MPPTFTSNTPFALGERELWTQRRLEPALEPDLPIVDSHQHVWDDERGHYLMPELLADLGSGHNIVSTVFVQARVMYRAGGPEALRPIGEVEFVNGIAAASASGRYGATRLFEGIVGFADLQLGDAVQPVLEALVAAGNGRFKGIRQGVSWDAGSAAAGRHQPPRHLLLDAQFRRGFQRLAAMGLSFDAWLFHPQLPELQDLLKAFPDTRVVLNHVGGHLGITPYEDHAEVFRTWSASMRELARHDNLSVKLGGLGMLYRGWDFHLRPEPPSSQELADAWRPWIETCIEAFGPGRCMFESNFPVDKQSCGYGVAWNAFKRITQGCSAADKAALYHDTAARVYRLPG